MTLNESAELTKKSIAFFLLFLVVYLLGDLFLSLFLNVYGKVFPKPPPPPDFAFQKIERLEIPTLAVDLSKATYRLELNTPYLPNFGRVAIVYKNIEPKISVIKEENFKKVARQLGFNTTAKKVSKSKRLWVDSVSKRRFQADVFFETFELETNKSYLERILRPGSAPTENESIKALSDTLKSIGFWKTDFSKADYIIKKAYIEESIIKETPLPDKQTLKYVSLVLKKPYIFKRKITDKKKGTYKDIPLYKSLLSKNPNASNVFGFVAKTGTGTRDVLVTDLDYYFYDTENDYGTYPILSTEEAWNRLVNRQASLVYIKKAGADYFSANQAIKNIEYIDIRSIDLAYYTSRTFTKYLQPIYVFSGKYTTKNRETGDVFFYLPAIDPQAITTNTK